MENHPRKLEARAAFPCISGGADGGGRTHTLSRVPDFESSASANSATSAAQLSSTYSRKCKTMLTKSQWHKCQSLSTSRPNIQDGPRPSQAPNSDFGNGIAACVDWLTWLHSRDHAGTDDCALTVWGVNDITELAGHVGVSDALCHSFSVYNRDSKTTSPARADHRRIMGGCRVRQ